MRDVMVSEKSAVFRGGFFPVGWLMDAAARLVLEGPEIQKINSSLVRWWSIGRVSLYDAGVERFQRLAEFGVAGEVGG